MIRKVCFTDCDGVHSNGVFYLGKFGDRGRMFNPRDGHGVQLLREAGWDVVMISGENDEHIIHRCVKLGIYYRHSSDKLKTALEFLEHRGYDPESTITAYIGDDVFDVPLLEYVHFPGCPNDSLIDLRDYTIRTRKGWNFIPYVTASGAGQGAFREFAEHLLSINRWPIDRQLS